MESPFEKLEQLFHKKNKPSKKALFSLFDAAGIPKDICWRSIYKMIFDEHGINESSLDQKLRKPQFEPIMEKALNYARTGLYTEKSLLTLVKDYNAISFSVCDSQLTDVLNELNLLSNEFKSTSIEHHNSIKALESETIKTVESTLSIEEKTQLIKSRFRKTLALFQKDLQKLDQMSRTDYLTGLYNRRFFDDQLKIEISQALKERTWINLLLLDIDDFKRFNDRYGHRIGDQALKTVTKIIQDHCREESNKHGITFFPCRYGGEEFAVILPAVSPKEAGKTAESIKMKISHYNFVIRNKEGQIKHRNLTLTVSIGMSTLDHLQGLSKGIKTIVQEADDAMYEAKKSGKNCIRPLIN
jgi:diguanylate cyclase (GGDEF)-like protein